MMAAQSKGLLPLTLIASGAIRTNRFVKANGAEADATEAAIGVSQYAAADGEPVAVDTYGTAVVESGGVFSAGVQVESDADGKAVVYSAGVINGRALQASTASGQMVEILVLPK
ncbi:MAG: DUF2190 family protein [Candidatus Riflebacteria bacterium]|nr:DUF2190 family protein [Candidatus Riflebacteria bacterium]